MCDAAGGGDSMSPHPISGEAGRLVTPRTKKRYRGPAVGRERALVYKTLVLTGLRLNELNTLTVAQLDLTPGSAHLLLDAADEKSREGNAVAVRDDLAADLRQWITDTARAGSARLFAVPTGLRRILDRDLAAAGIPKRDDRGRTVDVHALRTTFGTLLSRAGVSPRTAQAAMRHSDIKLTMGVYTDPRLLDTRAAVDTLPALPLPVSVAPTVAPTGCNGGPFGSSAGNEGTTLSVIATVSEAVGNAANTNEKAPEPHSRDAGALVGLTGFEPATSWSRTKRPKTAPVSLFAACWRTPPPGNPTSSALPIGMS